MGKTLTSRSKQSKKTRQKKVNVFLSVILALLLSSFILVCLSGDIKFKYIPTIEQVKGFVTGNTNNQTSDCSVHFINLGQGDSTFIISDNKTILIDAGENDKGNDVVDYLKSLNIKKIDLLVMTHPHSDHIGGMDIVINEFDIGKILMPKLPDNLVPTTRTYTDVLTAIAQKGLKITPSKVGMAYDFGKGRFSVIAPVGDFDELNDTSLVAKFTYDNNQSFLLTGDIEKPAESAIMNTRANLDSDVLKVAHHGSSTSTSKKFIEAVSPDYCIISVADMNKYKHPNKSVLDLIKQNGSKMYRTDYNGTIIFDIVDNGFKITTKGINPWKE